MLFVAGIAGIIYFWSSGWIVLTGIIAVTLLPFILLIKYHNRLFHRKDYLEKKIAINEQELSALNYDTSSFEDGAEFIDPAIVPKVTLPSGEEVPCMGMGTFGSDRVSAEEVSAAVAGAIRSGYRMFDCAACYGNEHQIGEVFKTAFDEGVVERKDLLS